jgi:hypothetical protein
VVLRAAEEAKVVWKVFIAPQWKAAVEAKVVVEASSV